MRAEGFVHEIDDHPGYGMAYRDTGCDLFPSCLRCPLPACRYDVRVPVQAFSARTSDIRRQHAAGRLPEDLAAAFGVSLRTVYRALEPDRVAKAATRARRADRDSEIVRGRDAGSGVRELARRFDVSLETVYRALSRAATEARTVTA